MEQDNEFKVPIPIVKSSSMQDFGAKQNTRIHTEHENHLTQTNTPTYMGPRKQHTSPQMADNYEMQICQQDEDADSSLFKPLNESLTYERQIEH